MRYKGLFLVAGALFLWVAQAMGGLPVAREKWSLGLMGGGQRIYGDPGTVSSTGPGLHFLFIQRFSPKLAAAIDVGYTELDGSKPGVPSFFTELLNFDLIAQFKPIELGGRVRPMLNAGLGGFNFQYMNGKRYFDGEFLLGGGLEVLVNRQFSLQLSANYHLTTGDDLDGVTGGGPDSYLALRGGVVWHLGERLFGGGGGGALPTLPVEVAAQESTAAEDTLAGSVEATVPMATLADSVRQKIRELERRVREQEQKVETLRRVVEEKREQVDRLEQEIAALESRIASGKTDDFETRYKHALQLYLNHQNEKAIAEFSALIRDYPNHKYVSNCHYWIGEAYFVLGDYQQAIRAFEQVLNYSNSPKLDDALIMLGRANLKLGDVNQATYYLKKLIRDFPDSEYVGKAKKYLASLQ